jgi:hypothetical protein
MVTKTKRNDDEHLTETTPAEAHILSGGARKDTLIEDEPEFVRVFRQSLYPEGASRRRFEFVEEFATEKPSLKALRTQFPEGGRFRLDGSCGGREYYDLAPLSAAERVRYNLPPLTSERDSDFEQRLEHLEHKFARLDQQVRLLVSRQ